MREGAYVTRVIIPLYTVRLDLSPQTHPQNPEAP